MPTGGILGTGTGTEGLLPAVIFVNSRPFDQRSSKGGGRAAILGGTDRNLGSRGAHDADGRPLMPPRAMVAGRTRLWCGGVGANERLWRKPAEATECDAAHAMIAPPAT